MFSQQDILHFRTFGLRRRAQPIETAAEVAQLSAEVTAALADAYGSVGTSIRTARAASEATICRSRRTARRSAKL